jgi:hypothetical protein
MQADQHLRIEEGKAGGLKMEDEELLVRARKRAEAKLTFYTDLGLYLIVNGLLFALWVYGGGGFPWFLFVLFFWGLGVASHGLILFRQSDWFDRMADTEYKRMLERIY